MSIVSESYFYYLEKKLQSKHFEYRKQKKFHPQKYTEKTTLQRFGIVVMLSSLIT